MNDSQGTLVEPMVKLLKIKREDHALPTMNEKIANRVSSSTDTCHERELGNGFATRYRYLDINDIDIGMRYEEAIEAHRLRRFTTSN